MKQLCAVNESLTAEVTDLKAALQLEALEAKINDLLQKNDGLFEEKSLLVKDMEAASQYVSELETKIHGNNNTSLELLKQLKESEQEIDTLKTYVVDLKSRIAVYIPV